jgi:hypothetical protein
LASFLIDGFSLVTDDELTVFLGLFVTHGRKIFEIEKVEFFVLLLDRLFAKFSLKPKIISAIIAAFCDTFQSSEEFAAKWAKAVTTGCDLPSLFEGLTGLAEDGIERYQQWASENQNFEVNFQELRLKEFQSFEQNRRSELRKLFEKLARDRTRGAIAFFSFTNQILNGFYGNITIACALSACVRHFHADRLLLMISFFMRKREALLTGTYRFDVNQSDRKAITILGDPLFPSRRVERSPLLYTLPPFPGGKTNSILLPMPEIPPLLPLLPPIIQTLIATPFCQFHDFALRNPRTLKLSFSLILPLSDGMRLSILELVLNNGKKFEQIYEGSFLYGVEPLPGLLLKTANHLIYIEGMRLRPSGVAFRAVRTSRVLYTFYMSYFISGHFGPSQLFGSRPVVRCPIDEIAFCCPRYRLHKTVAVELSFISGWRFILIPDGDRFLSFLAMVCKFIDDWLSRLPRFSNGLSVLSSAYLLRRKDPTKLWTDGSIDTFTYLCLLNRLGCRSLADYTQYYVFPWIIGDYNTTQLESAPQESFRDLSLPMGQIGPERAPRFDSIFEDSGYRYFYGTHYMHLGVVLYFMFRIDPFCLFSVYLHRGWDHQNRLFCDVYESWMGAAYTSPADVKELIPEFFCVPDFLENVSGLPVNTGNWTHNSDDFVSKMRHFLESEKISAHLPRGSIFFRLEVVWPARR